MQLSTEGDSNCMLLYLKFYLYGLMPPCQSSRMLLHGLNPNNNHRVCFDIDKVPIIIIINIYINNYRKFRTIRRT